MNNTDAIPETSSLPNKKKRLLVIPLGIISLIGLVYFAGWAYYSLLPSLPICRDNKSESTISTIPYDPTPSSKTVNNTIYTSESEIPPINIWPTYLEEVETITFRYRPDMIVKREGNNTYSIQNEITNNLYFSMRLQFLHDLFNQTIDKRYAQTSFCSDVSINNSPPNFKDLEKKCMDSIEASFTSFSTGNISGIEFGYNPYENDMYGIIFKKNKLIGRVTLIGGETGSEVSNQQIKTAKIILNSLEMK